MRDNLTLQSARSSRQVAAVVSEGGLSREEGGVCTVIVRQAWPTKAERAVRAARAARHDDSSVERAKAQRVRASSLTCRDALQLGRSLVIIGIGAFAPPLRFGPALKASRNSS